MNKFSGNFDQNIKIVIAWRFYSESIASLYQSKLKSKGIKSFLSNSLTTNLIPFGEGGIVLHVQEKDLDRSVQIIKKTKDELQHRPENDF